MKLLFIQGGSRVRVCNNGTYYVDGNFNNDIWKRYYSYSNNLTVVLRKNIGYFEEEDVRKKFNKIDTNFVNLKLVDDLYKPKYNYINILKRLKIKKMIKEEIKKNDKIIIRSIGNFYTNTALKYAKKYNKEYLVEVTGFAFEGMWYHSNLGKLFAFYKEKKLKKSLKNAPYAVYVTESELQKRYPCNGKILGCSDVELDRIQEEMLTRRKNSISMLNNTYKIGTAGFLNVKYKAQQDVIKAIYNIKSTNPNIKFYYEIVGSGNPKRLENLVKKLNLEKEVNIIGVLPHDKIFDWYDNLDIYVHPSHTEGLCRCIVEAMSRACPVICSNAGGNIELIDKEYVFKKRDINQLTDILKNINKDKLLQQAEINYKKAMKYEKEELDKKRDEFYNKFVVQN